MLDLLKQRVDYSLNQLLGIEVHEDTVKFILKLNAEQKFIVLSQLSPSTPQQKLALLGDAISPDLTQAVSVLLNSRSGQEGNTLPHTKIYPINKDLMRILRGKQLESLHSGHLFLAQEKIQLSREEVNELIFEFQLQTLQPVLVFPETTPLFIKTPKLLSGLAHRGCLFLLDWESLTGTHGHLSYKIALHLLEQNSVMGIGFKSASFAHLSKPQKLNKAVLRYLKH